MADQLEIRGWVKNLENGEVNIHAEGEPEALKQFIKWCHSGPKHAVVTDVLVKESTPTKDEGFTIIR